MVVVDVKITPTDRPLVTKSMARLSKFRNWHNDVCGRQDGIKDDHVDITTGGHDMVSEGCRWRSGRIRRGTIGDTSWSEACRGVPERQRRRCLRGRRGVGNSSVLFRKPRRMALSELRTFSRFTDF